MSYVVMFPQVLPMNESDGLVWQNIFTIPVGCLCFVDVVAEAATDTVCYPVDAMLRNNRAIENKISEE